MNTVTTHDPQTQTEASGNRPIVNDQAAGNSTRPGKPPVDCRQRERPAIPVDPAQSAIRLMVIIILTVFLTETFEMIALSYLPYLSRWAETLIDSTMLVAAVSPALYLLVTRPMARSFDEQRRIQQALNSTRERLDFLLSSSPAMIYTRKAEADYRATFISENVSSQLGYDAREFLGDSRFWASRIHPDDAPQVSAGLPRLFEEDHYTHEYRFLHKDGTYHWMHDQLRLVRDDAGNPWEIIGSWIDINDRRNAEEEVWAARDELERRVAERTKELALANQGLTEKIAERNQAEGALIESEARYRQLVENANDVVYTHDLAGRFTSMNGACERIMGYSREEALKLAISDILEPAQLEMARRMTAQKMCEQDGTTYELEVIAKDGRRVPLEVSTRLILEGEKPIGVQGIARDITERKHAEEDLQRSEASFRELIENATDIITVLESAGTISYASPPLQRLLGYSPEDLVGKTAFDLIHADDLPDALAAFSRTLQHPGSPQSVQFRFRHADGSWRTLEAIGRNAPSELGFARVIVNSRDVTERKRAEDERDQLLGEREILVRRYLEAHEDERRRLAYDIHDGPAQHMIGAGMYLESYLAERQQSDSPQVEHHLVAARGYLAAAIQDTRRIMSDLRPPALDDFGLVQALKHYFDESMSRAGYQVDYQTNAKGMRLNRVTETALFRIAQEATTNALKHSGSDRVKVSLRKTASRCVLEVRDEGVGFDVQELGGTGSGSRRIGLLSMRERAGLVGGKLRVQSAPGQGTTIRVEIPLEGEAGRVKINGEEGQQDDYRRIEEQ